MKILSVEFENCYGIKKLSFNFEFQNKAFAIYAPNGVMKTSFAKSFYDVSKNKQPQDLVFINRKSICDIQVDGNLINLNNILVIDSYNPSFKSEKISTLLANKELKEEYEKVHKEIGKSKNDLVKKLSESSGIATKKIEETIDDNFNSNFYNTMLELKDELKKEINFKFLRQIQYKTIFDAKVLNVISGNEFIANIEDYIKAYDELIEKSPYLRKNFDFSNADNIKKQLDTNNFFTTGHSVNLNDGVKKTEYLSAKELEDAINNEKKQLLSDEHLKEKFNSIENKLTNSELRNFRKCLIENQKLIAELQDIKSLAKKMWIAYLSQHEEYYNDFITKYQLGAEKIQKITQKAKTEKTDWENVVSIFNNRFSHLPFSAIIANKEDVILKGSVESLQFIFKDDSEEKIYNNQTEILNILSTGECRALYILNIIFEIEARKKEGSENILIIDDIADSFDYKNKYAIIEYLKYISEYENFYMIILTHNFDFLRTLEGRSVTIYKQCLIAMKNNTEIELKNMEYIKNPFINNWKNNLKDPKKLLASIPFLRNIIEYTHGSTNKDYLTLTSLLHKKSNTDNISIKDIKTIFNEYIKGVEITGFDETCKVIDLLFYEANKCLTAADGINLENKIILSIAIRVKSEIFMIREIADDNFVIDSSKNPMWKLLKKYQELYNNKLDEIAILKRVNLITSENIHVNSFMYEPILDMGDWELRNLYSEVRKLIK